MRGRTCASTAPERDHSSHAVAHAALQFVEQQQEFCINNSRSGGKYCKIMIRVLSTLHLLAYVVPLHALTPPKSSHVSPTPSVRRRNHKSSAAIRVRGGDNATDALLVRGGTGKKAKKPRKRRGRRWPTYGKAGRDRSRRDTPKAEEAPVVETPVAKDFNQLKEVPQGWIDRTCEEIKFRGASRLTG